MSYKPNLDDCTFDDDTGMYFDSDSGTYYSDDADGNIYEAGDDTPIR